MTNFNYDNYDDDTKAKYDDGIEFLDDDFSFDEDDDDDNIYDIPRYSDCLLYTSPLPSKALIIHMHMQLHQDPENYVSV